MGKRRKSFALLAIFLASRSAAGDPVGTAVDAINRALPLLAAKNPRAAESELEAALAEGAHDYVLVILGAVEERLGKREQAIDRYQKYLELEPRSVERSELEGRIASLEKGVRAAPLDLGRIVFVEAIPPGGWLYEGKAHHSLGKTPWGGRLNGKHTLLLDRAGFFEESIALAATPKNQAPVVVHFSVDMTSMHLSRMIEVHANVDDADVFLDSMVGGKVAVTPAMFTIGPGRHRVIVAKSGYQTFETEIDLESEGIPWRIDAVLVPARAP